MKNYPEGLTDSQSDQLAEAIVDWLGDHVDVGAIFGLNYLKEYLSDNVSPEDVFETKVLENWAFDNGFKRFE